MPERFAPGIARNSIRRTDRIEEPVECDHQIDDMHEDHFMRDAVGSRLAAAEQRRAASRGCTFNASRTSADFSLMPVYLARDKFVIQAIVVRISLLRME